MQEFLYLPVLFIFNLWSVTSIKSSNYINLSILDSVLTCYIELLKYKNDLTVLNDTANLFLTYEYGQSS